MVTLKKNVAVSDSGFVFNPTTGDSFSLNAVGSEILHFMKEEKSEAEIKSTIQAWYDIDADTLEKDYYDFLKMLGQFNLLDL
ncbi:MAG: PqqD family protein [Flavobacteriales bacterium]|nr:PqqD family protein [Flavobacteriales bacterium]